MNVSITDVQADAQDMAGYFMESARISQTISGHWESMKRRTGLY